MLLNHVQQAEAISTNPSKDLLLQHNGGSSLYQNAKDLSFIANQNSADIFHCKSQLADLKHFSENMCSLITRLCYSLLESHLLDKNEALLHDLSTDLFNTTFEIINQLQQQPQVQPHSPLHDINIPRHSVNENDFKDNSDEYIEPPPAQQVKVENVAQEDDNIFAKLNEFIFEYNKHRNVTHQINGDAIIRCFRDNGMDYTDFKDLNRNLKRYGVRAGPVRKLWRFLNPVEMNGDDDEEEDEHVVVLPIGAYTYIPVEYQHILFEQ